MKKSTFTPSEIVSSVALLSLKGRAISLNSHKAFIPKCFIGLSKAITSPTKAKTPQKSNTQETITSNELNFSSYKLINNISSTSIYFENTYSASNRTDFGQHNPLQKPPSSHPNAFPLLINSNHPTNLQSEILTRNQFGNFWMKKSNDTPLHCLTISNEIPIYTNPPPV